ncbi:SRPBCC domain-containing protein [Actinomadura scrupuli]|uniref:SRPBCC family protein n=1 Tax=Actinomadura scrupuli TaxID=559629 RepID=UPI003D993ABA
MRLENTLSIPVPAHEAWQVLLDIERIAPCVPGAALTSHDGDRFQGKVKVKLGPIGLAYSGTVTFVSRDEAAKVAVMEASGRETRGGGTANAVITCRLTDHGDTTDVLLETELAITGKPAQFGRSTLADVATTLIGQFAANLADEIAAHPVAGNGTAPARPAAPGEATSGRPASAPGDGAAPRLDPAPTRTTPVASRPAAEPIDLLQAAGGGIVRRVGPIAAATALLILLLTVRRRRSPGTRRDTGPGKAR